MCDVPYAVPDQPEIHQVVISSRFGSIRPACSPNQRHGHPTRRPGCGSAAGSKVGQFHSILLKNAIAAAIYLSFFPLINNLRAGWRYEH